MPLRTIGESSLRFWKCRTGSELSELAKQLKSLHGAPCTVMGISVHHHNPMAKLPHDMGLYVSIATAKMHSYRNNNLRRVKVSQKGDFELMNYNLARFPTLLGYILEGNARLLSKRCGHCCLSHNTFIFPYNAPSAAISTFYISRRLALSRYFICFFSVQFHASRHISFKLLVAVHPSNVLAFSAEEKQTGISPSRRFAI